MEEYLIITIKRDSGIAASRFDSWDVEAAIDEAENRIIADRATSAIVLLRRPERIIALLTMPTEAKVERFTN